MRTDSIAPGSGEALDSVTQVRVVRGRLDRRKIRMRPGTVNLRGLHESGDHARGVVDCELLEQKAEFRVVRLRQLLFHGIGEVPEFLLEGSERFLAGLVVELLVG